MVLSRKDAGFTSLKGNSKQKFYKETYGHSAILYRSVKGFSHSFIVLTLCILISQNREVVWHWIGIILVLKNVAVCSNHVVINFIGNHFQTYSSEIEILVFWY